MSSRHVESAKKDNRLAYALAQSGSVWPLAAFIALAAVTAAGMVLLSYVLGSKRAAGGAEQVYESGMTPVGSVRQDVPVHYWRVATMFVIFDVEAIFIITWALCRDAGWSGYLEMAVFVGVLLVALLYAVRAGMLRQSKEER